MESIITLYIFLLICSSYWVYKINTQNIQATTPHGISTDMMLEKNSRFKLNNTNGENIEYCFEVGHFFKWQHTVDIGTEKEIFLKNFTLGYYNNAAYIRLAYATNSSMYIVDEHASKSAYYKGRISATVFNTSKQHVFTFDIEKLKFEDTGIYGLRSYYRPPAKPPSFEVKDNVDVKKSCGRCIKPCPAHSSCIRYVGWQNCSCQQMYYMGASESYCYETKKTLLVVGLILVYNWQKDYENNRSSLYKEFSYDKEINLLAFLHFKHPAISGIHVVNIANLNPIDLSPIVIEFHIYFSMNGKIDLTTLKIQLQDGISDKQLVSIHADNSPDLKITIVKNHTKTIENHSKISIYYLIGGSIGGFVLLMLMIAVVIKIKKRRNKYIYVPPEAEHPREGKDYAVWCVENVRKLIRKGDDYSALESKVPTDPIASSSTPTNDNPELPSSTYTETLCAATRDLIAKEVITDLSSFAMHLELRYSDIDQIKADNPNITGTEIVHKLFQKYEQVNKYPLSWSTLRKKLMDMGKNNVVSEIDKTYAIN